MSRYIANSMYQKGQSVGMEGVILIVRISIKNIFHDESTDTCLISSVLGFL